MKTTNDFPIVAIIGRANVGKSMLFNRLVEKKKALVSDTAGTTRDRNYGICNWRGFNFNIIDTGGITKIDLAQQKNIDEIEEKIVNQAKLAVEKADLIIFLTDGQINVLPEDKEAARLMRESEKPVLLVINKIDSLKYRKNYTQNLLNLGFTDPLLISAKNGGGVGDLLDVIVEKLGNQTNELPAEESMTKIAIIGKPNVGKSSILNGILGEDQVIVSPIPHTTRSPQDIFITYKNTPILLIDTAGIRRKNKIEDPIEQQSVKMAFSTLIDAEVILFVIEAGEPLAKQDKRLISFAIEEKRSVILVVNKWDLIPNPKNEEKTRQQIWDILPSLTYLPIVFTSATEKHNIGKLLPIAVKVSQQRRLKVEQEVLDRILYDNRLKQSKLKKMPRIYSFTQNSGYSPNFTLVVDNKALVPEAYPHILKKALRQKYEFLGTPVSLSVVKKQN
ncbi:MAG: ribosome biogenesis GTPase Der [Patescibacteria group bacterium]